MAQPRWNWKSKQLNIIFDPYTQLTLEKTIIKSESLNPA